MNKIVFLLLLTLAGCKTCDCNCVVPEFSLRPMTPKEAREFQNAIEIR